jgi:hypothetical protein
MSKEQLEVFRQWLSTLPEQDMDLQNACQRIFIALDYLTGSNAR